MVLPPLVHCESRSAGNRKVETWAFGLHERVNMARRMPDSTSSPRGQARREEDYDRLLAVSRNND